MPSPHSPFSLVTVGARAGFGTRPLARGRVSIGSSAECGVRLEGVAPVAAQLVVEARDVTLEPLVPGVLLDGREVEPGQRYPLRAGATFHVGPVLLTLHAAPRASARRVWPHGSFEMRLEEQCLRAAAREEPFELFRLHLVDPGASSRVEELLSNTLRLTDVLGVYGPGEYEVLLPETGLDEAAALVSRIEQQLSELGVRARLGRARWPDQALGADELIAVAARAARGDERQATESLVLSASRELKETVARIASSSLPVLILGETGAGKERTAELIHQLSARRDRPLLRLNCAALNESLLESELFGYERGAFTGAVGAKPGLLQTANTGTVFLDEIGELPPTIQAKLLRVIEERQVLRLGGLKPTGIDVRFVSATNRDLEQEVARGTFRIDLYYRIAGAQLWVPPLRERLDELPALATAILTASCARERRATVPSISADALELMRRYHWPGNVRELRNVLERAVLLVEGDVIARDHLPVEKMLASFAARRVGPTSPHQVRTDTRLTGPQLPGLLPLGRAPHPPPPGPPPPAPSAEAAPAPPPPPTDLKASIRALERQRIEQALSACAGNQSAAARLLGLSRRTFISRLTEFGFPRPRRKGGAR